MAIVLERVAFTADFDETISVTVNTGEQVALGTKDEEVSTTNNPSSAGFTFTQVADKILFGGAAAQWHTSSASGSDGSKTLNPGYSGTFGESCALVYSGAGDVGEHSEATFSGTSPRAGSITNNTEPDAAFQTVIGAFGFIDFSAWTESQTEQFDGQSAGVGAVVVSSTAARNGGATIGSQEGGVASFYWYPAAEAAAGAAPGSTGLFSHAFR